MLQILLSLQNVALLFLLFVFVMFSLVWHLIFCKVLFSFFFRFVVVVVVVAVCSPVVFLAILSRHDITYSVLVCSSTSLTLTLFSFFCHVSCPQREFSFLLVFLSFLERFALSSCHVLLLRL